MESVESELSKNKLVYVSGAANACRWKKVLVYII